MCLVFPRLDEITKMEGLGVVVPPKNEKKARNVDGRIVVDLNQPLELPQQKIILARAACVRERWQEAKLCNKRYCRLVRDRASHCL